LAGFGLAIAREHDLVYGRNPVNEALRGRRAVHRVWVAQQAADSTGELLEDAGISSAPEIRKAPRSERASSEELTRLAGSPDHQGVVAEVDSYPYADPTTLLNAEDALVLVLDQVQDPRNLGAICRTAEVAGASGVVVPARRAAGVTPAVCKASAGAVEHLQVARVTNIADWLGQAKGSGAWIHGAQAGAEASYVDVELAGRTVLVLGGEAKGLRPRVAGACDTVMSIPQRGRIGSLNVSAAAAVLIFEAMRQRRSLD
jgi:23S rRNA (guanosine2251-2'-O)-methyltransferase